MSTARVDIGFRVAESTNTISVVKPTGGALTTVTLTDGLYMTGTLLAAEISTRLAAYDATLSCSFAPSTQKYTFTASAGTFDIQFTQPTLRLFLGVPLTTKYTAIASLTGNASPGAFLSTQPWHSDTLTWVRSRKAKARHHNRASAIALGDWREFGCTAVVLTSEVSKFRTIMSYLMQGLPASLFLDSAETGDWNFGLWLGRRAVVLAPGFTSYADAWLGEPRQTILEIPLEFREFAA